MNQATAGLVLRDEPDWFGAAQVLIEGCAHLPSPEERVRWMERLCLSLGDALYPAFLQVLCHAGEHGDAQAQAAVADTLVLALQSGRLPSGRQAAWGATSLGAFAQGSMQGTRAMGPIEYLCAWFAQPGTRGPLSATAFDRSARALLGLVSHSDAARRLYCLKLMGDADDPLGGAWSRSTRQALRAMASTWEKGGPPQRAAADAVDAFLAELRKAGEGSSVSQAVASWIPPAPMR